MVRKAYQISAIQQVGRLTFLAGLCALFVWAAAPLFTAQANAAAEVDAAKAYSLPSLRIFNRVALLVKEQYVDPSRLHPREMFLATLDAINNRTPAVLISYPNAKEVSVKVGKKTKVFSTEDITSLWDMSFRLRSIFSFIDPLLEQDIERVAIERAAVNGMLSTLDPHSILLDPKYFAEVDNQIRGQFGGCGFLVSMRHGEIIVISPLEGSPAEKAGIKGGDKLQQIDGDSTANMGLDEAISRLKGEPGSIVKLTVLHKGETEPKTLSVSRDIIKVDSVTWKLLDGKIGYVRIKSFQANVARDARDALDKMDQTAEGLKGVIIDLRENGGGLLDQAVGLANNFLDGGTVVITQGANPENSEEELASEGSGKINLPLVVLVDEGSASASEIFAAAIQKRGYGIVVGRQTFGKGSVQIPFQLPDKSAAKLTVARYMGPDKESIQSIGIAPDILLEPAVIKSKENLDLFPDKRLREENLDAHLSNANKVSRRSPYHLTYVFDKPDEPSDEIATRELHNIIDEDYEMRFAARVLREAKHAGRDAVLKTAAPVVKQATEEEAVKLQEALKKYDIDWSEGTAEGNPSISLRTLKPVRAKAGETLQIELEAKNTGDKPIWRLYGLSQSLTGLFANREFLFGKVMPGASKRWTVSIKIPKDAVARRDAFKVNLRGNDGREAGSLEVPVMIEGRSHPVLAYSYYIDDERGTFGDGNVHLGEKTDLVVVMKNIGTGVAEEPIVLLKNASGSALFIDAGRQELKPIAPGATASARLTFTARKATEPAQLELALFDTVMGDGWSQKLSFPIKKSAPTVMVKAKGFVRVKGARVPLWATLQEHTAALAYAHDGDVLQKISAGQGMVRVRAGDGVLGFIAEKDVDPVAVALETTKIKLAHPLDMSYTQSPPQIRVVQNSFPLVSGKKKYELSFRVTSSFPVKDAYLFVNDRKTDYYALDSKGPTDVPFAADIQLKPGVNVITLVARADATYAQREVFTVYSTTGDPYLAQNGSNEAETVLVE